MVERFSWSVVRFSWDRVQVMEQPEMKKPETRRRLPIGIQTFREIRDSDCYHVDKTSYIGQLVNNGKCFFLSRPRCFGKSLFVDTLKEAFEGNRELLEGLTIHDSWDWDEHDKPSSTLSTHPNKQKPTGTSCVECTPRSKTPTLMYSSCF